MLEGLKNKSFRNEYDLFSPKLSDIQGLGIGCILDGLLKTGKKVLHASSETVVRRPMTQGDTKLTVISCVTGIRTSPSGTIVTVRRKCKIKNRISSESKDVLVLKDE